jgi:diguanylate cyclase (GGDEF)-like protein
MLAFRSAVPTTYDSLLTLLSLLIAILVTGIGFCIAETARSKWGWMAAGAVIGAGIATMHYSGMSAMSIAAYIRWDPILVTASIAAGVLFAAAAMWAFRMNGSISLAAGLLTTAICMLHFTAMGAARVEPDPTVVARYPQIDNTLLATAIAGVTLLVLLSGLAAALINRDTARDLGHRADHDDLTGLPNRGFVWRMIETSINSGSTSGFALLFVDLDRFKSINDRHGHLAGDYVLREAAQRMRRAVRDKAIVARTGGDEFIVVRAGSEPASAKKSCRCDHLVFSSALRHSGRVRRIIGRQRGRRLLSARWARWGGAAEGCRPSALSR